MFIVRKFVEYSQLQRSGISLRPVVAQNIPLLWS
jgi:hypothetical protein